MAGSTNNFRYEFKTVSGAQYLVELLDIVEVSSEWYELQPDSDGFTLNWEGASDETYKPIVSSTLTFNLWKSATTDLLVSNILAWNDARYIVSVKVLTSPNNYDVVWRGFLLQDAISTPDSYYNTDTVQFKAVDGFGLLKDIYYTGFEGSVIDNLTRAAFIEWLVRIAEHLPLNFAVANEAIFALASNWFEDSNSYATSSDPLATIVMSDAAFVDVDKYNVATIKSYYDILYEVLKSYNLQISQSKGKYLIIQQNTYSYSRSRRWYYDKFGTAVGSGELAYMQTPQPPTRLKGGSFQYILPVKEVNTEYNFKHTVFKKNMLPSPVIENTVYSLGTFESGVVIKIEGKIQTLVESSDAEFSYLLNYNLQIKNGSKYLKRVSSSLMPDYYIWTATPSVIDLWTHGLLIEGNPGDYSMIVNLPFSIFLPETEELEETVTFEYTYIGYTGQYTLAVTQLGSPITSTVITTAVNPVMEGTQKYVATVGNNARATLELESAIIGDGAYKYSAGALLVEDFYAVLVKSNAWMEVGDIGVTSMALHSLRCREMLALRRNTVKLYSGTFSGIPDIHKGFTWLGINWCWQSINWTANYDEYTGTAMAIILDRTGITVNTPLISEEDITITDNNTPSSGVSNTAPSRIKFTPEGGLAVLYKNRTGANSVKGMIVAASTSYDNAIYTAPANADMPVGVVYENGIADTYDVWVVVSGVADVLMKNTVAPVHGYVAFVSSTAGRADCGGSIPANAEHWREIGHLLESKTGGTDVFSKVTLHFN